MVRKTHLADLADAKQIARAIAFSAHARNSPLDRVSVECGNLEEARKEADRLTREFCRGGRRAGVYAITPEKWSIFVPDTYQPTEENIPMSATVTVEVPEAIKTLSNEQLLAVYNRWSTKPCKKFEKRKCGEQRVAKLLADLEMSTEDACAPPSDYAGEGWDAAFPQQAVEEPVVEVEAPAEPVLESPARPDIHPTWIAQNNGLNSQTGTWDEAVDFLREFMDGLPAKTSLIDALSRATPASQFSVTDGTLTFSLIPVDRDGYAVPLAPVTPAPVVITPPTQESDEVAKKAQPSKRSRKSTGKIADAPKVSPKYQAVLDEAAKGKLPEPPDFSAETHKPYRGKLEILVKAAKAQDIAAMAEIHINPISSSPIALWRYREAVIVAIKAKQAKRAARAEAAD